MTDEAIIPEIIPPKKRRKKDKGIASEEHRRKSRHKGTNTQSIISMRAAGKSQKMIARAHNVSQALVSATLQRYGIDAKSLESFKEHRADILAGLQETVASTLSIDDIKSASVRDRGLLMGIMFDKERLERGQSTSNSVLMVASAVRSATDEDY